MMDGFNFPKDPANSFTFTIDLVLQYVPYYNTISVKLTFA